MSGEVAADATVIAIGNDDAAVTSSSTVNSLPCAQGRVGEGCEPLAANSAGEGSAQGASLPPPNLPQQAGGGAKTLVTASATHTATVGQPAKPQTFAKPGDGPGIGGAVFALILVVSLILGLGWLARRMPGVGRASNTNALRIVGSLALGPRDRVVVVDVGGTQLLVGVGQNGMTTLHTLEQPLPVAQPSQGTAASPFAQLLAQHFGKKP